MPRATTPKAAPPARAPAMRRAVAPRQDGDHDQDDQADAVKQVELLRRHVRLRFSTSVSSLRTPNKSNRQGADAKK